MKQTNKRGLTPKQEQFAREYLVDLNPRQAALRAGYAPGTARNGGFLILRNPAVRALVERLLDERRQRVDVSADRVVAELARVAFASLGDYVRFGPAGVELKPDREVDAAALAELSEIPTRDGPARRVKLLDKLKALELLGRHLGLFSERVEQAGELKVIFNMPRPSTQVRVDTKDSRQTYAQDLSAG